MAGTPDRMRVGLILFIVVGIMACPLALGYQPRPEPAFAAQPFATVPPVQPSFEALFTATPPLLTPIPTVGPGQYFEAADAN